MHVLQPPLRKDKKWLHSVLMHMTNLLVAEKTRTTVTLKILNHREHREHRDCAAQRKIESVFMHVFKSLKHKNPPDEGGFVPKWEPGNVRPTWM